MLGLDSEADTVREKGAGSILDYTIEKPGFVPLRQRLQLQNYSDLQELIDDLARIREETRTKSAQDDPSERATASLLYSKVSSLIKSEQLRQSKELSTRVDSSKETLQGFPDRHPEPQVLFTSSVAGPLFSSSGQLDGILIEAPSIHVSQVLPSAPVNLRLIGDVLQDPVDNEFIDLLSVRREPLHAVKRPKQAKFESFGLGRDRSGTILDDSDSVCVMRTSNQKRNDNETEQASKSEHITADDMLVRERELMIDEDLMSVFDAKSDESLDVTASLLKLSNLQATRLMASPFLGPSTDELALAAQITTQLQEKILESEVVPKHILNQGVRAGFTIPQMGPSYSGTLPPTIAQAAKATLATTIPFSAQDPTPGLSPFSMSRRK